MRIIFIGIRNFDYFSRELLDNYRKIVVVADATAVPEWVESSSTVVRVREIYDELSKVNQFDLAQCLESLAPLIVEGGPHAVFCNEEANLQVADAVRSHFTLYNHMHGKLDHFRDKLIMKKLVQRAKLRTPAYTLLDINVSLDRYADLAKAFNNKFIVKPCSSVGSRGVHKVFSQDDFARFIAETRGDGCIYEAEEFIDGELYQYDLALQGGVELYSAVSHYSCPMADLQEGRTLGSIMLGRETALHKRITKFGKQCALALGAKDGCFHMELFHSNTDELVFLEVAARSPGLMTVPAYASWEGVNMYDIELCLQTGQDASAHALPRTGHVSRPAFFVVFPKVNGFVTKLNAPAISGHFNLDWRVEEGKQVMATTTNVDFAGKIFVSNENEVLAKQDFINLTERFTPVVYR